MDLDLHFAAGQTNKLVLAAENLPIELDRFAIAVPEAPSPAAGDIVVEDTGFRTDKRAVQHQVIAFVLSNADRVQPGGQFFVTGFPGHLVDTFNTHHLPAFWELPDLSSVPG